MGMKYSVSVQKNFKRWIAQKSVKDSIAIYQIFEQIIYPYYLDNFKGTKIKKITLPDESGSLALSSDFGKTLRLEAIEKDTNVISLVDTVFQFYLENNS